jgi:hypothetical protein
MKKQDSETNQAEIRAGAFLPAAALQGITRPQAVKR